MFDFYRATVAVPDIKVANPEYNTEQILNKMEEVSSFSPSILAFPELSVTGYYCQDLFFQKKLQKSAIDGIINIVKASEGNHTVIIVGAPLVYSGMIYNAAFVILNGKIVGIPVKSYIPNYHEFYEKRWFQPASELSVSKIMLSDIGIYGEDYEVPIGKNLVFRINQHFTFGVEICEDLWAPLPPSTIMTLAGAEVIINISASNETISKNEYRKNLVKHQSAACLSEYLYVSAGSSESTQDLIFSGQSIIAENGSVLNESRDFIANDYIMIADMDLEKIRSDRLHSSTFADNQFDFKCEIEKVQYIDIKDKEISASDGEFVKIHKMPFVPTLKERRLERCKNIFAMQVGGLVKRLSVTGTKPVVGVSGGMDSTLALLVSAMALKELNRPDSDLIALTMPAFGTTDRTYNNSIKLIKSLGTEPVIINIKDACIQHLNDLGHSEEDKDITYENTQARERTQVLMDYANCSNGIVVGTGDLSELALGWCTYNADQMSMYGVNGSIPKTLVKWLIDSVVESDLFPASHEVLKDILDTPISPELLPPDKDGNISQKTEDKVGPYELHDFFLYYSFRYGFTPAKVYFLATKAFREIYSEEEILRWLELFYKRFFSQQFKRSCMPDSVKVGSISLSPRGDWRMPSDASCDIWLKEIEELKNEGK